MKTNTLSWLFLCLLCSALISSLYFKGLFLDPANHATTYGGDGLTIHYNLQYHATYGDGAHLDAQYYPHGETIFMTAAQGFLAVVLAKLRYIFPDIGNHAVAISNILNYGSNIISVILLFLCLIKLKVRPGLSVIFALLITFLAPQIYRQTCGHYSLSYSFLIPAIIYYLLQRRYDKKFIFFSILIAVMLVCLGLNDPYLLAIGGSLMLGSAFTGMALYKFKKNIDFKILFAWALVATLSLVLTMGILESLDSVSDRSQVQFGFFVNISSLKGLLYPHHTWLSTLISKGFHSPPNSFESHCYLGFIPILTMLFSLILMFTKKRKITTAVFDDSNLFFILGGGLLVLIFSFSFPFCLAKDFSSEYLSKILQFRAPGRFSWVFYYCLSVTVVRFISLIYDHMHSGGKKLLAYLSLSLIVLFWSYEIHEFISWRTQGNINHNAFSEEKLKDVRRVSEELELNKENYHGLFLLPTEHGWTDKVYHGGSWRSNYEGYRYSVATGLPLINGKLSRMSVGNALESMQLVSHPLIPKSYLDQLDPSRDILILKAKEEELSIGETWFVNQGQEIYSDKDLSLHKVSIETLADNGMQLRETARTLDSIASLPIVYEHYEENQEIAFAGKGSRTVEANASIFSIPISTKYNLKNLNLSFWYYVDISNEGGPFFFLRCKDENGNILKDKKYWALDILDTDKGWLRAEMEMLIPEGTSELILDTEYKSSLDIDELLLKEAGKDIYFNLNEELFFNNYLVNEER